MVRLSNIRTRRYMDILLIIIAILGFVTGVAGLGTAVYTLAVSNLRIEAAKHEALASLVGSEERLNRALERKLNERILEMRQAVQSDSFDMIQATLEKQRDLGPDLGMANFGNWGG